MTNTKRTPSKKTGLTLEEMIALGYIPQDVESGFARHDLGKKPEPFTLKEVLGGVQPSSKSKIPVVVFSPDGSAVRDGLLRREKRRLFALVGSEEVAIQFDKKEGLFFELIEEAA